MKPSLPSEPADLDQCDAVPPCIRNIIQALKTSGDLDHYQRLVLVWYLKWVGKEVTIDLFRRFAYDYDESDVLPSRVRVWRARMQEELVDGIM